MLKINTVLLFVFVTTFTTIGFCQSKSSLEKMPSIGGHIGVLSYMGDIKGSKGSTIYTYWRPAYGFYLEKKIGSIFGITVNGMFGKVSKSQLDESTFLNFETSITNIDLNLLLDFDNGKLINRSSVFAPYFSVGFGFLSFNPKGDLKNENGQYYHWTDGTLRNIDQSTLGSDTLSTIINRDYTYESELKDTIKNYSKTSFTLPVRFGLKFKLARNLDARVGVAYMMTFTDYLDNYATGGNDNLFYTSFGLQYNFANPDGEDKYKDFNFSSLDKIDSDGDGVKDIDDVCQNTPKDIKVDNNGCPLDSDKDGVPDYLDKEANTLAGKIVNSDGVTLTDEMISARESLKDSIQTERRTFKADDLSKADLDAIQRDYELANSTSVTAINIPEKYKALDIDKDNYISAKEVTNAIDNFFDGENNLTAKDLHQLIDFYFEQ